MELELKAGDEIVEVHFAIMGMLAREKRDRIIIISGITPIVSEWTYELTNNRIMLGNWF